MLPAMNSQLWGPNHTPLNFRSEFTGWFELLPGRETEPEAFWLTLNLELCVDLGAYWLNHPQIPEDVDPFVAL